MSDESPDDIEAALKRLAETHGAEALAAEFARLQGLVRRKRRESASGPLATAIREALRLRDKMKADGVAPDDIAAGLERLVRDVWPKTREWHYICDLCNDTGLRMYVCQRGQRCNGISTRIDNPRDTPGKYRRLCAMHPDSDYSHDYGEPCICARGDRFKRVSKPERDDLGDAARKPSQPSRFGR
jgi:hypothetical protein